MSHKTDIELAFRDAYVRANSTSQKFPPDVMLQFYAYYKQATEDSGIYTPSGDMDIRNAFKLNALLQVKGLSRTEAKEKYIELVNLHISKEE